MLPKKELHGRVWVRFHEGTGVGTSHRWHVGTILCLIITMSLCRTTLTFRPFLNGLRRAARD